MGSTKYGPPPSMMSRLIQFCIESQHHLHFLILSRSTKRNISMCFLIHNLHMITHPSLFVPCNTKQYRKRLLQRLITTPNIVPKPDLGAITNFKSDELGKKLPPSSYMLPNYYVYMDKLTWWIYGSKLLCIIILERTDIDMHIKHFALIYTCGFVKK